MKTLRFSFLVYLFILSPLALFAQDDIEIQGNISDESGKPLVGVDVTVRETIYGSATDFKGYYNIEISDSESGREVTLEAEYMGYIAQSKKITLVSGPGTYDFQLEVDVFSIRPIVVSAQRREENMQKVPISVATVDRMEIQNSGADRMVDLQYSIPNLTVGTGEFNRLVYTSIRGISGWARSAGGEARASYYIDDVYMGRSIAVNRDLLDLERVEILRGPQGTLFGKNTISGAIQFTTRKPHGRWEGTVSVDAGNYNNINTYAIINAPLVSNKLFVRVTGKYMIRDGFVKNLYNDSDLNGWEIFNGRLQLRYLHSEALDIILTLNGARDRRDRRTPTVALEDTIAPNPREVSHDAQEYGHRDMFGSVLTINYQFPNRYLLKSITAYQENKSWASLDEDSSPLFVITSKVKATDHYFTEELRMTSPLYRNYNFVSGLFYFYQKANLEVIIPGGPEFPIPNFNLYSDGPTTTNSIAAYFNGNYHLSPKFSVTGGIRYTYEDKNINWSQENEPTPSPLGFIDLDNFTDSYSKGVFTPKIGLNYFPNDQFMFYGSITQGYTSGGWQSHTVKSLEFIKYDPEYVTSYEIGLKSTTFENRLRFNVSAFLGKYKDYQVEVWQRTSTGSVEGSFMMNAGKVTSKGLELELSALPWKNLTLMAAFGYTDAKYDEFKNGGGEGIDYDGNRVVLAPETEYTFSFEYRQPVGHLGSITVRSDFVHKDAIYDDPSNAPEYLTEAYDLINGRIGFENTSGSLGVYLWGKNITDELYMLEKSVLFLGVPYAWYGIGRTYGIQIKYSIIK